MRGPTGPRFFFMPNLTKMGHLAYIRAPLAVNSSAAVANLNADKVDGQDANAFLGANQ